MCGVVYGGIASSAADMKLMRLSGAPRISHASFHQASYFFYCVWNVGGWEHVMGWGHEGLGTRETGDVMGWGCEGLGV